MCFKSKYLFLLFFIYTVTNFSCESPKSIKSTRAELTFWQSATVGALAGATEVSILGQPLSYAMNQAVQHKPVARNPLAWYRGGLANVAGMAPITAIQQVVNVKGQALVRNAQAGTLTDRQRMAIAFVAGATSALAATPSESVPVYMQKPECRGISTIQALRDLKVRSWRGLVPTAGRDGLFTVGYSALAPIMQTHARTNLTNTSLAAYPKTVDLSASVAAGVFTAVATQSLAVIKTKLQADPFAATYRTSLDVARAIYKTDGVQGYFKGMVPRGARIMVAIPVLNAATEFYKDKLLADR